MYCNCSKLNSQDNEYTKIIWTQFTERQEIKPDNNRSQIFE